MKLADLLIPAVDWTGQTWAGRIDQCASMLFLHGYIPQSQREKIGKRLQRECEAASAIEARRATDAEGGVVEDESAVGEAETPNPNPPSTRASVPVREAGSAQQAPARNS